MKCLIIFFCSLVFFPGASQSIQEVRKEFHKAVLDPKESRGFHEYLTQHPTLNPTIKAYQAVSEAMLAQVVWSPFTKFSQVKKYARQMEMAVEQEQDNIEIRFLRLAIEYNLPRFLGMSTHLSEDRDVILDNIVSVSKMELDPSFCHYILYFLNDTGLCTPDQFERMRSELKGIEG